MCVWVDWAIGLNNHYTLLSFLGSHGRGGAQRARALVSDGITSVYMTILKGGGWACITTYQTNTLTTLPFTFRGITDAF